MVNATQMCRAGGKFYAHYNTTAEMTEFVTTLSSSIGITIFDLVRTKPGHNGGTMVHRRVAMYLAQRISPLFNVQVTGYLDELLLTGRVELGKEKTPEELDAIWKSRIAEEQAKIQADYLREKLSKELLAIDEDRASKRACEEEDKKDRAAKRQRDDAAVEEEKEAKRKRDDAAFEEDMRVKKEMGALELANFKKKEELNYNKLLVPFVEDIQNRTNDAHVKALCKDIGMALLKQAKFLLSGESSAPQETKFCDDVTTIGRKLGFDRIFVEKHRSALGKAVAKEYRQRNDGSDPPSTEKYVNGGNRPVCTYDDKDSEWIEDVVRQYLIKQMPAPVVPQLPRAPLRTINNYFTQ
jgi:hypothetical protein